MIGDVRRDVDEELVDNFFRAPDGKTLRIWKVVGEPSVESEILRMMVQIVPEIPVKEVNALDRFSRNDTSQTTRGELDRAWVCMPALEIEFEDPDNPGNFYSGFIEGKENINKFFLALAKRHNKEFPLSGIVERAKKSLEDDALRASA